MRPKQEGGKSLLGKNKKKIAENAQYFGNFFKFCTFLPFFVQFRQFWRLFNFYPTGSTHLPSLIPPPPPPQHTITPPNTPPSPPPSPNFSHLCTCFHTTGHPMCTNSKQHHPPHPPQHPSPTRPLAVLRETLPIVKLSLAIATEVTSSRWTLNKLRLFL